MFSRFAQTASRFAQRGAQAFAAAPASRKGLAAAAVATVSAGAFLSSAPLLADNQQVSADVAREILNRLDRLEKLLQNKTAAAADVLADFPAFTAKCKSLLKKNLTPNVWLELKDRKTPRGFTLERVIQSGVDNQDSSVGVYAGDHESYYTFRPLFDAVISDYHAGYDPISGRHRRDLNVSNLRGDNPDPEGKYIISTRIRVGRNLAGISLSPGITRGERREVERRVVDALNQMQGDLSGKYYPLSNMSEADRLQLVKDHFLFKKGDRFLESAGCNRDWPEARGIFHSADKRFLVWLNEEDQLRIISMQPGGDMREVFARLSRAIESLEKKLEFSFDDRLGYISSCPTNLGTAMRASVHVKLPLLSKNPNFKSIAGDLGLDVRGIHGEHSESEGGVYDISNKRRLGLTEVDCVQIMHDGVKKLITMEKALEKASA